MFLRGEEADQKKEETREMYSFRRRWYARFVRSVRSVEVRGPRGAHVVREEERIGLLIAWSFCLSTSGHFSCNSLPSGEGARWFLYHGRRMRGTG